MISPRQTIWHAGNERRTDQSKVMTLRFVKASVVLLLGFILAGQGVFMAAAGNSPTGVSHAGCKCCKSGTMKCSMAVCCAGPVRPSAPIGPAPLPASSQNEWHALATSATSSVLTPPSFSTHEFRSYSPSFAAATAVPLFRRNCSYLI
jgi:hypothetical protein